MFAERDQILFLAEHSVSSWADDASSSVAARCLTPQLPLYAVPMQEAKKMPGYRAQSLGSCRDFVREGRDFNVGVLAMGIIRRQLVLQHEIVLWKVKRLRFSAVRYIRAIARQANHTDAVVGIRPVSASPCGLTKSAHSPEFDATMDVAKEDVEWNVDHICGIAEEVAPKLYGLAEQIRPSYQERKKCDAVISRPFH